MICALTSLTKSKPDWRWQLTPSGRFAHRKEYALSVGEAHGLELVHYESLDGFRHEQGKIVRGHLFVMKKSKQKEDEL
jgi:predicted TPR repeat methyltransferase